MAGVLVRMVKGFFQKIEQAAENYEHPATLEAILKEGEQKYQEFQKYLATILKIEAKVLPKK